MFKVVALAVTGKRVDILYTGGILSDALSILQEEGFWESVPFDLSMMLDLNVHYVTEEQANGLGDIAAKLANETKGGGA